jgi:rhamnogalacturonyl hydrolase YesR
MEARMHNFVTNLKAVWLSAFVLLSFATYRTCPGDELQTRQLDALPGIIQVSIGVTRSGNSIAAYITQDDLDIHIKKTRLLLVAGLDGSPHTPQVAHQVMHRFYSDERLAPLRQALSLSILPCGNPDGLKLGLRSANGVGGDPSSGYPPVGDAYSSLSNPEAQYLWRWIGMHAPDIVVELVDSPEQADAQVEFLSANQVPIDSLTTQLRTVPPCRVGTIPAHRLSVRIGNLMPFDEFVDDLLNEVQQPDSDLFDVQLSPARLELQTRDQRSTLSVCQQLAEVYGHDLSTIAYIPVVACIGRLRLADLLNQTDTVADIESLVTSYVTGGQSTLTDKSTGSEIAGHILWGALYDTTKKIDYKRLAMIAADRAFSESGQPLEAMPTHNEMSDAVFMGCPTLAQAGRLSGDSKYFDMCVRHMRFMLALNLRADGLHRHSPLDETAWGRGNGFPALGLALALEDMPASHADYGEMQLALTSHLRALLPHQDVTGAWHQVIDHPESYREFTSTCMITYAMIRGVRRGWLVRTEYEPAINKAWSAIKARIAADGSLVDVCTGTGKQKSLRDYLDRTAILGPDPRGGAMALLVATEVAAWEAEQ